MNKTAVMISIRPLWCNKIASGSKTIEIRKSQPRMKPPFRCYIYQTKPKYGDWNEKDGRVIGEFVCDKLIPIQVFSDSIQHYLYYGINNSCVPYDDIVNYIGNNHTGYGWNITNLVIYDKPKEISDFYTESGATSDCPALVKMKRPPQSWCYVEGRTSDENA